jgi:predicted nucleic acid-binding Zn ribbon protein
MANGDEQRRDLEPVGAFLDGVLGRIGATRTSGLSAIRSGWLAATGPGWERTTPERLADGVLVVEVPDGTTASRLQFDQVRVIKVLNQMTGSATVKALRFRVARAPSQTAGGTSQTQ